MTISGTTPKLVMFIISTCQMQDRLAVPALRGVRLRPNNYLINTIGAGFPLMRVIGRLSNYSPIDIRKSGKTHMLQIAANSRSDGETNRITAVNPDITSRGLSLHLRSSP
jgi:hypothetical protein